MFEDLLEKFWRSLLHALKAPERSCLAGVPLLPVLRVLLSNESVLKYSPAPSEAWIGVSGAAK